LAEKSSKPLNQTKYFYQNRTIDDLGGISAISYDKNGNVITQNDQLDRTVSYGYDNRDRQTTTTTPLGFNSSKVYDAVGNITSNIDANNHATTYLFDVRNRQTEAIDALNQSTKTTYSAQSNKYLSL
jgi:YD repeat-containing protein